MMRKSIHLLLVLALVLNPLQTVFAHILMPGDGQAHSLMSQHGSTHAPLRVQSAALSQTDITAAMQQHSLPGVMQAAPPQEQHLSCGDCAACVQCLTAIIHSLPASVWLNSSTKIPYLGSAYHVNTQPALRPPRIS